MSRSVSMPPLLNLIARSNGVGLDRDVDLIHHAASAAGYEVTLSHCREISPFRPWWPSRPRFAANLFLERIFPRWLHTAPVNLLVPNQERFPVRHLDRLKKIDHVLCKSRHALDIFRTHHPSCHFTGFTSRDLHRSDILRNPRGLLHLAGRSTLKGTETILKLWQHHPEWPTLTLLQHRDNAPDQVPDNVSLVTDYLSEEELTTLVNQHPIHLCPSLSEGWGHYLVEAMTCGALVITTDGPPMNELIRPDRGLLVEVAHTEPRHLGTNFHVDPASLEKAITQALALPEEERHRLGKSARVWATRNHEEFSRRFVALLDTLLSGKGS